MENNERKNDILHVTWHDRVCHLSCFWFSCHAFLFMICVSLNCYFSLSSLILHIGHLTTICFTFVQVYLEIPNGNKIAEALHDKVIILSF